MFIDAYAAYQHMPTDRSRKQIADLLSAMAELPENPLGHLGFYLRVQVLRDLGMVYEIAEFCKTVLPTVRGPIKDPLEYRYGEALVTSSRAKEAQVVFEALEKRTSSLWTAQAGYYLAKIAYDNGDARTCERRCRQILHTRLLRDDRPLWRLWGDAWLTLGDADRAIQCYEGTEPEPLMP